MKKHSRALKLVEQAASSSPEPDYFKPLPAIPTIKSVPTTPDVQYSVRNRLRRAASVSSWKPPANWVNNAKSSAEWPPVRPNYAARSYSLLIPEPLASQSNLWTQEAPPEACSEPAQKMNMDLPYERPLPAVPDIPRRNPSRLSLREHPSQRNSPRVSRLSPSSSHSDISSIEGLSNDSPQSTHEQLRLNPALPPLSPLRTLRKLPNDEEQRSPTHADASKRISDSRRVDPGDDITNKPQTGDQGLFPRPLTWRKPSSGSFSPESFCTCSQTASSVSLGQRNLRSGKLRAWASRGSGKSSKHLENKSEEHQHLSKASTRSSHQGPIIGNTLFLGHVVQYGKDLWFQIKQTGSTSTERKETSSRCPVHLENSPTVSTCPAQRDNVLLRLPGGFALVRRPTSSTISSPETTRTTSVCDFQSVPYESYNGPYMRSQAPVLDLPQMRTSWATYASEVTATSTRAIHNCSRISFGSLRSPDSGSNTHICLPSPLAQEFLPPHGPSAPQHLPVRSSSLPSPPSTKQEQRVDSVVGTISPKQGLVQSAKGAWKSWKSR